MHRHAPRRNVLGTQPDSHLDTQFISITIMRQHYGDQRAPTTHLFIR
ncbi:MAG: hypothetical protein ACRDS0_06770 [Pseudonocardiaceae bacterium]